MSVSSLHHISKELKQNVNGTKPSLSPEKDTNTLCTSKGLLVPGAHCNDINHASNVYTTDHQTEAQLKRNEDITHRSNLKTE